MLICRDCSRHVVKNNQTWEFWELVLSMLCLRYVAYSDLIAFYMCKWVNNIYINTLTNIL